MQISIVVPVHNEAENLESSISTFLQTIPESIKQYLHEFILVENGSTDGTYDACCRLRQLFPDLIRISRLKRGSYGEAIKAGMIESTASHVCILECDFLSADFVAQSIRTFDKSGVEFLVGSKRHRLSVDRRPIKRRVLTYLYNFLLLRLFIGYPGTDTHGLKAIEANVAKRLCALAVTTDEVFQTEIVLLAWKTGVSIQELPVRIVEKRSPTVSITRRVPKVLRTVRDLRRSLDRFHN